MLKGEFSTGGSHSIEERLRTRLDNALKAAAEKGAETAKEHAPVKSGRLKRSIKVYDEDGAIAFGSKLPYAAVVEYGGSEREAQPYLLPGRKAALEKFAKVLNGEEDNAV